MIDRSLILTKGAGKNKWSFTDLVNIMKGGFMANSFHDEELIFDYIVQFSSVKKVDLDKKTYHHILIDIKIDEKQRHNLDKILGDKDKYEFENEFKKEVINRISKHRFKLFTGKN